MLVRRTNLNHGNIAWQGTAAVQPLGFAQENGDIVRITALNALAHICPDEEALMEEYAFVFSIGVRGRTFGVEVVYAYIPDFSCIGTLAKCLDEHLWRTGNAAQVDVVA